MQLEAAHFHLLSVPTHRRQQCLLLPLSLHLVPGGREDRNGLGAGDPRDEESAPDSGEDIPQSDMLQKSRPPPDVQIKTQHVSPAGLPPSVYLPPWPGSPGSAGRHTYSPFPGQKHFHAGGGSSASLHVEGWVCKDPVGPAILSLTAVPHGLQWSRLMPPGLPSSPGASADV